MRVKLQQQGFTLLETMVAMAVLTVILLPLTNLMLQSHQLVTAGGQNTTALYTAQHILEQVRAGETEQSTGWTELAMPGWYYRVQTKNVDYGLQQVTVTVRYPQGGKRQELSLTMLQRAGLSQ